MKHISINIALLLRVCTMLSILLCSTLSAAEQPAATAPSQPRKHLTNGGKAPNVLFIAIDDMNNRTSLFNKDNPIKTNTSIRGNGRI